MERRKEPADKDMLQPVGCGAPIGLGKGARDSGPHRGQGRRATDIPAMLWVGGGPGGRGHYLRARVVDLTPTGACISLRSEVAAAALERRGAAFELLFSPRGQAPVHFVCRTRHVGRRGETLLLGARFTLSDPRSIQVLLEHLARA